MSNREDATSEIVEFVLTRIREERLTSKDAVIIMQQALMAVLFLVVREDADDQVIAMIEKDTRQQLRDARAELGKKKQP